MTTKEKVLEILTETKDFYSGEMLAEKCKVSRVAINKAIKSLREEGYVIEAVTNKGYKISGTPDKLVDSEIISFMESFGVKPNKVLTFDSIDSTNTDAKRRCALVGAFRDENGNLTEGGKDLHRTLLVASSQTNGRGRMGRVFVSPQNSGIYFSLIYSPKQGVSNPVLLTAAAAVAVSSAINELYDLDFDSGTKIKWVNDIFLSDSNGNLKKISGILTEGIANFESRKIEAAIVGIGINVRNGKFEGDLGKIAGSIEDILKSDGKTAKKVSRNRIVAKVVSNLLKFYDEMESENAEIEIKKMFADYRKKSMLIGKTVQVNPMAGIKAETYKAKVIDITDSAELLVETENGEKKALHSGEVSLHSYDFV